MKTMTKKEKNILTKKFLDKELNNGKAWRSSESLFDIEEEKEQSEIEIMGDKKPINIKIQDIEGNDLNSLVKTEEYHTPGNSRIDIFKEIGDDIPFEAKIDLKHGQTIIKIYPIMEENFHIPGVLILEELRRRLEIYNKRLETDLEIYWKKDEKDLIYLELDFTE